MIFSAKNEEGIPTWLLIVEKRKTVTRRLKPIKIGKIIAVQPGRGKKQVCKIKILSCKKHMTWFNNIDRNTSILFPLSTAYTEEAKKEGFHSWDGLLTWFEKNDINIEDTYRIEFEKV